MNLKEMKRRKKVIDRGSYLADERERGQFTEESIAIVMDNTLSPEHNNRLKIKYVITPNIKFWAGYNTVVVFHIKKKGAVPVLNNA